MKSMKKIKIPEQHYDVKIEFWAKEFDTIKIGGDEESSKQNVQLIDKVFQNLQQPEFKRDNNGMVIIKAVSYTHLTLPTKRIV